MQTLWLLALSLWHRNWSVSRFYCRNNTKALIIARNGSYNRLQKLWERMCLLIVLKVCVLKSNNFMTGKSMFLLTFHCSWRHWGMQFTVFRMLFFSTSRINYCDVSRTTNINLMQSLVGLLFLPIAGAIHYQLKKQSEWLMR